MKLYYKLITSDNIQLGIQIQNLIFPMEDGSELYKLSIIGSKDYPILKYFIVYDSIMVCWKRKGIKVMDFKCCLILKSMQKKITLKQ